MKQDEGQPLKALIVSTRYGWVSIVLSASGVQRITLPSHTINEALDQIQGIGLDTGAKERGISHLARQIKEYFQGERSVFECRLDLSGSTSFQRAVWEYTMSIPYGEIRSYRWVAGKIGKANACRAVGQALARNPIPIIIPCHRVVYEGGRLGGFGGKANIRDFKRRLLELEGTVEKNGPVLAD